MAWLEVTGGQTLPLRPQETHPGGDPGFTETREERPLHTDPDVPDLLSLCSAPGQGHPTSETVAPALEQRPCRGHGREAQRTGASVQCFFLQRPGSRCHAWSVQCECGWSQGRGKWGEDPLSQVLRRCKGGRCGEQRGSGCLSAWVLGSSWTLIS